MDTATVVQPMLIDAKGLAVMMPELLTDRQAAGLCGVGRSTWRRLLAAGKAPAPIHLGGSVRWRRRELLAWLDAGAPPRTRWEWRGQN